MMFNCINNFVFQMIFKIVFFLTLTTIPKNATLIFDIELLKMEWRQNKTRCDDGCWLPQAKSCSNGWFLLLIDVLDLDVSNSCPEPATKFYHHYPLIKFHFIDPTIQKNIFFFFFPSSHQRFQFHHSYPAPFFFFVSV